MKVSVRVIVVGTVKGFLFSFHLLLEMKAEQTEENLVLFEFLGGTFTKREMISD